MRWLGDGAKVYDIPRQVATEFTGTKAPEESLKLLRPVIPSPSKGTEPGHKPYLGIQKLIVLRVLPSNEGVITFYFAGFGVTGKHQTKTLEPSTPAVRGNQNIAGGFKYLTVSYSMLLPNLHVYYPEPKYLIIPDTPNPKLH